MVATGDGIQRYPLLRLLVPYVIGIVLADALWHHADAGWLYGAGVCAVLLLLVLCTARRVAWWSGMAACCLFLVAGGAGYALSRSRAQYAWPAHEVVYEARVEDAPRHRARSMRCVMEVTALHDSAHWQRVGRKVLAYMQPCGDADSLRAGDVVCFRGTVRAPRNFAPGTGFDYARYVTMQGAAGTVYLSQGSWAAVGEEPSAPGVRMLRLRHTLLAEYMERAFGGDVLGVLSALTLGDKRVLGEEVRAVYADAGVSHVLALSGLHVGMIYAMLVFLLRGLLRSRSLRWLREVLTVAVLWLFAMMVGMSASVVRAVSMYTLYILARWVSKESSPLSVLSLAAFAMLLVQPLSLFDVGFQLSFMAMVPILCVEPRLEALFRRSSLPPVPAYLVGVACMSLAAQLGTFPLVLYHFGTFPTYFLLTNLVVIPYLYVVLLLIAVWWLLALAGGPWAVSLGRVVQLLVEWLNRLLACIADWPFAVLRVEDFSAAAVLFTYLFLSFAALFLIGRWQRGGVLALAALLGLLVTLLLQGVCK